MGTHVDFATGAFGGAPFGATKRCTCWGGRMRTVPLRPPMNLLMRQQSSVLGGGDACERADWGVG
eukprot:2105836-Pyramimonas_sp.AAC.1